jgi:hypothetical protein
MNIACSASIFSGGSFDGFSMASIACASLFLGGAFDGFSSFNIACPVTSNIYLGGSYDGFSYSSTLCPVPPDIYLGGSFDGFAFDTTGCPPSPAIFVGGSFDGFATGIFDACPVPIFLGGSYDGFSSINSGCSAPPDIYLGGSYNGFSSYSIECPATIYSGGSFDGFSTGSIACSSPFIGGSYDGFSFNSVACSFAPIFVGGSYDGFSFNSTACPAIPAIFAGGSYDGFSFNSTVCIISQIFVGGSYDGFNYQYHNTTAPCFSTTLPIDLLYFTAQPFNENNTPKVKCNWATASETNNDYFTVEKTIDAINFSEVNKLNGAGNSNVILYYSMIDENPYIGQSYYRLKQTDFNGIYSYSELVPVFISINQMPIFLIYPNPANDIINVIASPQVEIGIFNIHGQLVKSLITNEEKTSIDISTFAAGMYFLKMKTENGMAVKKFIKE